MLSEKNHKQDDIYTSFPVFIKRIQSKQFDPCGSIYTFSDF